MDTQRLDKAIILIGLKHSGKSSIARALKSRAQRIAIDLDERVSRLASLEISATPKTIRPLSVQASIRQYYTAYGKSAFQKLELAACQTLIAEPNFSRYLIAAGGGLIDNPEAMSVLKSQSLFVFLDSPEQTLLPRILKDGLPPFLDKDNLIDSFHQHYLQRTSLARRYADIEVAINQESTETAASLVWQAIKDYDNGR